MRLEDRALQMQGKGFFLLDSCFLRTRVQIQQSTLHYTLRWFVFFSLVNTRPYFIEAELCQLSELPNIERSVSRRQDGARCMEHHGGFQVSSAFLGPVRLQICCSNTNSRSPRPDEVYFVLPEARKSEDDAIDVIECNWAGTIWIWIWIWKGFEKTNCWCHLLKLVYFLSFISQVQLFLSWRHCKLVDPKDQAPAEAGQFPFGMLFGDGLVHIFSLPRLKLKPFPKLGTSTKKNFSKGESRPVTYAATSSYFVHLFQLIDSGQIWSKLGHQVIQQMLDTGVQESTLMDQVGCLSWCLIAHGSHGGRLYSILFLSRDGRLWQRQNV